MNSINKSARNPVAAIVAAVVVVFFITAITIAADLVPSLKAWLKATFTHHWIGKGVLSIILFGLVYLLVRSGKNSPGEGILPSLIKLLFWLTILGTVLIFLFFLFEAYWK